MPQSHLRQLLFLFFQTSSASVVATVPHSLSGITMYHHGEISGRAGVSPAWSLYFILFYLSLVIEDRFTFFFSALQYIDDPGRLTAASDGTCLAGAGGSVRARASLEPSQNSTRDTTIVRQRQRLWKQPSLLIHQAISPFPRSLLLFLISRTHAAPPPSSFPVT